MTRTARLAAFLLFLLLVLAVHSKARGQVAVPTLSPGSPQVNIPGVTVPDATFAPENPGAMQYGVPSRFGVGQVRAHIEQDQVLGGTAEDDVDGYYSGLRWATEGFSAGGEIVNLEDSDNDYSADVLNGAIALPMAKLIAFGVGLDTSTIQNGGTEDKTRGTILGFAVNFDEKLYIGLALGRDYLHRDQGADEFDSNRGVQKLGVGFRLGKAGQFVHLEYNTLSRDPHEDENGFEFDEQDLSHVVLEAIWRNVLVSAQLIDFGIDDLDGTTTILELGWVPKKGVAVLAHLESTEAESDAGLKTDVQVQSIAIAYQF